MELHFKYSEVGNLVSGIWIDDMLFLEFEFEFSTIMMTLGVVICLVGVLRNICNVCMRI